MLTKLLGVEKLNSHLEEYESFETLGVQLCSRRGFLGPTNDDLDIGWMRPYQK